MTREEAQRRNWTKGRVVGFAGLHNTHNVPLTLIEKQIFKEIAKLRLELLAQWDESTEIINGKPLPEHQCYLCNKRSNKLYQIKRRNEIFTVCRKHYLIEEEQNRICQTSERPS